MSPCAARFKRSNAYKMAVMMAAPRMAMAMVKSAVIFRFSVPPFIRCSPGARIGAAIVCSMSRQGRPAASPWLSSGLGAEASAGHWSEWTGGGMEIGLSVLFRLELSPKLWPEEIGGVGVRYRVSSVVSVGVASPTQNGARSGDAFGLRRCLVAGVGITPTTSGV